MASLLDKYRASQRRIRTLFAPHTAELCPTCPEPCCRKPTKVREFDVLLANAAGCSLPSANEAAKELVERSIGILTGEDRESRPTEPCDYLGENGCIFPEDLRPFECVRFICPYLKRAMPPRDMREVRDLLHKLAVHHRALVDAAMPSRRRI